MAAKAAKISIYAWEGTDKKGSKVTGELSGQNPALIKAQLRKQGINPGKVRKKSASLLSFGKRIKPRDIALFTRQMATMMRAEDGFRIQGSHFMDLIYIIVLFNLIRFNCESLLRFHYAF